MWNRIGRWTVQQVGQAAIGYVGRRGTAVITQRQVSRQVFTLAPPATIYIYGTRCRVTVHYQAGEEVVLEANLVGALQPSLTVEQDADGIYIITKPKPIATALTQIAFTLTMPPTIRLVAQLTPGDLILSEISGIAEIPPLR